MKQTKQPDPRYFNVKQYACWIFPAWKPAAAILLFLFSGCADARITPVFPKTIYGQWEKAGQPERKYLFGDGYATTWVYDFNAPLYGQWFKAEPIGGGDLQLTEINTHKVQVWRFSEMQGDTVCTLTDMTGDLHHNFEIRRTK